MIEDLPCRPANSQPGIVMPADPQMLWLLARWLRAYAGSAIGDLMGPTLVSGGAVSVGIPGSSTQVPSVRVTTVEGWPLKEIQGRERFAMRSVTGPTLLASITAGDTQLSVGADVASVCTPGLPLIVDQEAMTLDSIAGGLLNVTRAQNGTTAGAHAVGAALTGRAVSGVSRDVPLPLDQGSLFLIALQAGGRLVAYPLTRYLSTPEQPSSLGYNYAAAPRAAIYDVPLALAMVNSATRTLAQDHLYDLRLPPLAWRVMQSTPITVPSDQWDNVPDPAQGIASATSSGPYIPIWCTDLTGVKRPARCLIYTAPEAVLELSAQISVGNHQNITPEYAFLVNGVDLSGDGARGGFSVLTPVTSAKRVIGERNSHQEDTVHLHAMIRSTASAVHEIGLGLRLDWHYDPPHGWNWYPTVRNVTLAVRVVQPLPPII